MPGWRPTLKSLATALDNFPLPGGSKQAAAFMSDLVFELSLAGRLARDRILVNAMEIGA